MDLPEDWCENLKATGCQYPMPILDRDGREAFTLFSLCSTQLRTAGMAGIVVGLDYKAVELVADVYDFDIRDPELMDRLRVIESEYVKILAQEAKAKQK